MTKELELLGSYKLVLGLEVHVQLMTEQKMFCGCSADIWQAEPNTHVCPVCLGLPGALPVPNFEAIRKAQLFGLALNCTLNQNSRFDRKHYFYPDLPKGYQISQYKQPFCENGHLDLLSGNVADIERLHLEEDVAKSLHEGGKTLVDYNKSSIPLAEIVTAPTFKTLDDAVDYCKQLQNIARSLGISNADMEKGQMRLEANISLRTADMEARNELPKYKVEVKNTNSFRFMEKAVLAEVVRQRELLEKGETPKQENRGYNEATGKTVLQRSKEEANDYRYFPEPDIPPMFFDEVYINELKSLLPELPQQMKDRLVRDFGLTKEVAHALVDLGGKDLAEKFEAIVKKGNEGRKVANTLLNKKETLEMTVDQVDEMLKKSSEVINDSAAISAAVEKAISANPKAVEDFKAGKQNAVQFLVGQVMRETQGKAAPDVTRGLIVAALEKKSAQQL